MTDDEELLLGRGRRGGGDVGEAPEGGRLAEGEERGPNVGANVAGRAEVAGSRHDSLVVQLACAEAICRGFGSLESMSRLMH